MNGRIIGTLLGGGAALAVALPLALAPVPALAWSAGAQGYGYGEPLPAPEYGSGYDERYAETPGYGATDERAYEYGSNYGQSYYGYEPGYESYSRSYRYQPGYGATEEAEPYAYAPPPYYGSSEPPARPAYRGRGYVPTVDLNLRAGPSDMAPIEGVLPAGTRVRVAGPDVGGWWRITSPFGTGWVYSGYLAPG